MTDEPEDAEQSLREELDALVSRYVREVLGRPGLVTRVGALRVADARP